MIADGGLTSTVATGTTGPAYPDLISTASIPALVDVAQLAPTAVWLVANSACSAEFSPDDTSAISVNPEAGVTVGPFLATPATPYATSLVEANGASETARLVAPSLRVMPVCTMAPEPLAPPVSTPSHCDTIHCTLETLPLKAIVIGPLPGVALIARKITRRLVGEL